MKLIVFLPSLFLSLKIPSRFGIPFLLFSFFNFLKVTPLDDHTDDHSDDHSDDHPDDHTDDHSDYHTDEHTDDRR